MKFIIDFNHETDDAVLEELGAKLGPQRGELPEEYIIEINRFEDLETLLSKVDKIKKGYYSAIISFDPPTIYLDKDC